MQSGNTLIKCHPPSSATLLNQTFKQALHPQISVAPPTEKCGAYSKQETRLIKLITHTVFHVVHGHFLAI